jgi:hypothetical protein
MKMHDCRSGEASVILKRLFATVSLIEERTLLAYSELWDDRAAKEAHSKLVRAVGFGFRPESATEFVERFIADRTSRPPL